MIPNMRKSALVTVCGAVLLTGGLASAAAPTPTDINNRACFRASEANGFAPLGQEGVNVRVRSHEVYQMAFLGPCVAIEESNHIAIRSKTNSPFICTGAEATVFSRGQRCEVTSLRKMSQAEASALPVAERP